MNYEELSHIWNSDQQYSTKINLNKKLLREVSFHTITDKLKEIKRASFIDIAINWVWSLFLIDYLVDNFAQTYFTIPGVILLGIAVYSIVFDVKKLILYYSINNNFSVLQTQKKLAKLKRLEILDTYSLIVFIPLFFVPFIIVFAQGILGINVFEYGFSEREMFAAAAGSLVIAAIIIFFLKKYPNKQLNNAIQFIDELKEIEKDNN